MPLFIKISKLCAVILLGFLIFSRYSSIAWASDKIDSDGDGLSDEEEINIYHTDPHNGDTDGDGYTDGEEIKNNYNPLSNDIIKLTKKIEVNRKKQELSYFLGDFKLGTFKVSTGKSAMPTPKGTFPIYNKILRAWSRPYKLWMPYWLGLNYGKFGLHELPEWPDGTKEGANHLGKPVSHGCIRLGIGPAKIIYNWAATGTPVIIN